MSRISRRGALPRDVSDFLKQAGELLPARVEVHCIGALAGAGRYGVPFAGHFVEYVATVPPGGVEMIRRAAGEDSLLAQRASLHFRFFGSGEHVEYYERRLRKMFPASFGNLQLYALEAHDMVLTKLGTRAPADVSLAEQLVRKKKVRPRVLQQRYRAEVRPLVADPHSLDRAFRAWMARHFPHP